MQFRRVAALLAVAALLCAPGFAATQTLVRQMSLAELSKSADKIFRGRVLGTRVGAVEAGGVELPTVTYSLAVVEPFKGEFTLTKGEETYVEITMLGSQKPGGVSGVGKFSTLPELPTLQVGEEYLLMTSAPSALGLSTTIGLGQGCFHIDATSGMATNGAGWAPVAYADLATALRAELGK